MVGAVVKAAQLVALVFVGLAAVAAFALRPGAAPDVPAATAATAEAFVAQPRMLELGSTSCKTCKAMHQEIAQLRAACGERLPVQEIDVFRDEAAARKHDVRLIPTQIFLDAEGREVDRHVGFLSGAEIRARFARLGVACPP